MCKRGLLTGLVGVGVAVAVYCSVGGADAAQLQPAGPFRWETGGPVLTPRNLLGDTTYSVKDPSVVRYEDKWHLFCTVRGKNRSHAIIYLSFREWNDADQAPRHVLSNHAGYFCAPQVFFFGPQKNWYLICQAADESWEPDYQPAFATTEDISDPNSWTPLGPLIGHKPKNINAWLDFWVICDATDAYLFFTSLDGKMWRARTGLSEFPRGWSEPVVALAADIFEAGHTYRLKGLDRYLTIIEAQGGHGWRYYKAYVADRLDGLWKPLAAEKEDAFASQKNVRQTAQRWTDSISHAELIRAGHDQNLDVDPGQLRVLFQGVTDAARAGKKYGEIPWSLGMLEPER